MTRKRQWKKRLVLLLGFCLLTPIMLRWFEHNQVYHPSRVLEANGTELGRSFEDVYFRSEDGVQLNGWFFPSDTNSSRAALAVLLCHGNGGNISHRLDMVETLLATGVNVFLFDYRGYGRSHGYPSEQGTYRDAEAAYQWLRQKGFAGTNIVIFGESLGGGVAADIAAHHVLGGLILQSTFTCIPDIAAELFPWLPVRLLCRIKYDTLSKLQLVKAPVMVMHSRDDTLIRFVHGQKNFAAAREPKLFCELVGDHNDPQTNRKQFTSDIEKFLDLVAKERAQATAARSAGK